MFGDYFGQRADYSKGLIYSCRRKYLLSEDEAEEELACLDAPDEFKTRYRVRNLRLTETIEKKSFANRRLSQPYITPAERLAMTVKIKPAEGKFKRVANMVVGARAFDHSGQDYRNREDWIHKREAGVALWVNIHTGEVTTETPFDSDEESHLRSRSHSTSPVPGNRNKSQPFRGQRSRSHSTSPVPNIHNKTRDKAQSVHFPMDQRSSSLSTAVHSHLSRGRRRRSQSLGETPVSMGKAPDSPLLGTGSLFYDPEPVDELFQLLDKYDHQKKNSSIG